MVDKSKSKVAVFSIAISLVVVVVAMASVNLWQDQQWQAQAKEKYLELKSQCIANGSGKGVPISFSDPVDARSKVPYEIGNVARLPAGSIVVSVDPLIVGHVRNNHKIKVIDYDGYSYRYATDTDPEAKEIHGLCVQIIGREGDLWIAKQVNLPDDL